MQNLVSLAESLQQLKQSGKEFIPLFEHGSLVVEVYRPEKVDNQTPHTRDEVYVVISGSGKFFVDGKTVPFQPGDVLFVPAQVEHRFEEFTDNFATWVLFYGPEGGEAKQ